MARRARPVRAPARTRKNAHRPRARSRTRGARPAEPALPVLLLWRHPLVAAQFRKRLEGESFLVTDERIRGDEAPGVGVAAQTIPPDVPIVVVESEDGSALPVLVQLERLSPFVKPIVLSEHFRDESNAFRLLRAGVKGLMTYTEMPERLARALATVAGGGFWVPRVLLSRFVEVTVKTSPKARPATESALTPREGEILEDLLQNLSNKEIAARHRLTSRTIKFHVSNVLAKYGVKRRADLLLLSLPRH